MHGFCCKRKKNKVTLTFFISPCSFNLDRGKRNYALDVFPEWVNSEGVHQYRACVTSVSNQRPAPHTTPIKHLWGWYDGIGFAVCDPICFLPRIAKRGLWSIILWNTQNICDLALKTGIFPTVWYELREAHYCLYRMYCNNIKIASVETIPKALMVLRQLDLRFFSILSTPGKFKYKCFGIPYRRKVLAGGNF